MRSLNHSPPEARESRLHDMARELGIDVSAGIDEPLAAEIRQRWREKWLEDNKEAIQAYNERIAREGIWGARHRNFARSAGDGRQDD